MLFYKSIKGRFKMSSLKKVLIGVFFICTKIFVDIGYQNNRFRPGKKYVVSTFKFLPMKIKDNLNILLPH